MSLYIYFWYILLITYALRVSILWPLPLGWLLVCHQYKDVYLQIFKCSSFWLHGCCGEWEGWTRKPVNHTSLVAVVTPTGRPNLVRNRCVIKLFCGVVFVVTLPFLHFCWCRRFCHTWRTESNIFLFLLNTRGIWKVMHIHPYNFTLWSEKKDEGIRLLGVPCFNVCFDAIRHKWRQNYTYRWILAR